MEVSQSNSVEKIEQLTVEQLTPSKTFKKNPVHWLVRLNFSPTQHWITQQLTERQKRTVFDRIENHHLEKLSLLVNNG